MRYTTVERVMLLVGATSFWCGVGLTLYLFLAGVFSPIPPPPVRAGWHPKGQPNVICFETEPTKEKP